MSDQSDFNTDARFDIGRVKKDIDLLLGEVFHRDGSIRDRLIRIEGSLSHVKWGIGLLIALVCAVLGGIVKLAFFTN